MICAAMSGFKPTTYFSALKALHSKTETKNSHKRQAYFSGSVQVIIAIEPRASSFCGVFNIQKNKTHICKVVGLNPAIAERSKTNNIPLDQKEQINLLATVVLF
jgi:hypothetical protein